MSQTVINLGRAGADLNGTLGGSTAASTDDPTFCDWSGDNHLRNFGAGNLVSCPVGAWGFTSDFQLDWFGSFDSLTTASWLFTKLLGTGDQRSWGWLLLGSGVLRLSVYPSGTNTPVTSFDSSVSLNTVISADDDLWIRCTFDEDNGSSLSVVKFFYSFDGVTYTQLGSDRTSATVAPFDSTADLVVNGAQGSGSLVASGRGYYWRYQNGIGGTTEFEFDARKSVTSATETSWTESSANARTVTLARTTSTGNKRAVVVTAPLWSFSTDDYMLFPDDSRLDIPADGDFTVVVILRQWNSIVSGGRWVTKQTISSGEGWRIQNNSTNQQGIAVIEDAAGTSDSSGTGNNPANGALHTAAMLVDRTADTLRLWENGLLSTGGDISTTGAVADAVAMTVGRQGVAGAAYPDMELYSVAVFPRLLTATELSSIQTYYENKVP